MLIRKTEPKPIRVFLQDGSKDTWNPLFGSWFKGNLDMEAASALPVTKWDMRGAKAVTTACRARRFSRT